MTHLRVKCSSLLVSSPQQQQNFLLWSSILHYQHVHNFKQYKKRFLPKLWVLFIPECSKPKPQYLWNLFADHWSKTPDSTWDSSRKLLRHRTFFAEILASWSHKKLSKWTIKFKIKALFHDFQRPVLLVFWNPRNFCVWRIFCNTLINQILPKSIFSKIQIFHSPNFFPRCTFF